MKGANGCEFCLEHEVEQFEDDPLEYIRRDLSSTTEGGATRRHAASELIRALISIGLDAQVTHIVQSYIEVALQVSAAVIYLFTVEDVILKLCHFIFPAIRTKPYRKLEEQRYGHILIDSHCISSFDIAGNG